MAIEKYIEAGKITNTHGLDGTVRIEVWLDSPQFMKRFKVLYKKDGTALKVSSARVQKNVLLVRFEGYTDVNSAVRLKENIVYIDRDDAGLDKGAYFLQDLIGAEVRDEEGNIVGIMTEIMDMPGSNIYVVQGEQEHLIPAVPEFIKAADPQAGIITVHMIEGL